MTARLLVARLSALGDVVFAVPAVRALREAFPAARIDWLIEDRHAALVRGIPWIDGVIEFPRRAWTEAGLGRPRPLGSGMRAMTRHLRTLRSAGPYDAVLDLQGNLKSSLQLRWVRAELRVGFGRGVSKEGAHRRYDLRVADPGRVPRARRDLELVRALLAHHRHASRPAVPPAVAPWPLDAHAVRELLAGLAALDSTCTPDESGSPDRTGPANGTGTQAEREPAGPVLLHHGFTPYGRDKEWPVTRWAELCRLLADAGIRPLLLWTPTERDRAEAILAESGHAAALAPATPSLDHLMALLDAARLVVGTDSGPVHLAALRGRSVLALYGPTDPVRFRPPGPHAQTVSALADGAEPPPRDRSRRSPLMDALPADRVASAVHAALRSA